MSREFSGLSTTLRGVADTTERETTDMATNMDSMLTQVRVIQGGLHVDWRA